MNAPDLLRLARTMHDAAECGGPTFCEYCAAVNAGTIPAEVRPDPTRVRAGRWALVSTRPIKGYEGRLREAHEQHAGLYAYPFPDEESAEKALQAHLRQLPGPVQDAAATLDAAAAHAAAEIAGYHSRRAGLGDYDQLEAAGRAEYAGELLQRIDEARA